MHCLKWSSGLTPPFDSLNSKFNFMKQLSIENNNSAYLQALHQEVAE